MASGGPQAKCGGRVVLLSELRLLFLGLLPGNKRKTPCRLHCLCVLPGVGLVAAVIPDLEGLLSPSHPDPTGSLIRGARSVIGTGP